MPKEVRSPEIAVWSPRGDEIAVEDAASSTERILWIVAKDGSRLQKVISYSSETYSGIDWSPDGKTLYYSALEGGHMKIFSVSRDGGPAKKISEGPPGNYLHPRVSPDGRWIACSQLETVQYLHRRPLQ